MTFWANKAQKTKYCGRDNEQSSSNRIEGGTSHRTMASKCPSIQEKRHDCRNDSRTCGKSSMACPLGRWPCGQNATHPSSVLKFLRSGHEESDSNNNPLSLLANVAEQHDLFSVKENSINEDSDRSKDLIETAFCNEFTQRIKEYDKDIAKAKEDVYDLIGTKFKPKSGDLKPLWMVVSNIDSVRTPLVDQRTIFSSSLKKQFDAFLLFWELWPGDIDL